MLGASHAVLLGTAAAVPAAYDALVAGLVGVVSYWRFENDGQDDEGIAHAIVSGSPELDVDTIVQADTILDGASADGRCIAWPCTRGVYAQAPHNVKHKSPQGTIVVSFQHDLLSVKSTLVAADRSIGGTSAGPGGLSLEVTIDGAPRCYLRRQSDGGAVELLGQAGDVEVGQAYSLVFKWGPGGLSMALWDASGGLIRRVTDPLTDGVTGTSPIRFGAWHADISHHQGPFGRVLWLDERLSDFAELQVARPRTVTRAVDPASIPLGCTYIGEVNRPVPNVGRPSYLEPYQDNASFPGITIRRLAADPGIALLGTAWPGLSKHQYIKAQAWNHDEDLIFMNHTGLPDGSTLFIDGRTYGVRMKRVLPTDRRIMRWRPYHRNQLIYVTGKQVWIYDPYTEQTQQLSSFNGALYQALHLGKIDSNDGFEANPSYDGNRMVLSGRLANGTPVAFAYDLQTDTKYPEFNFTTAPGAGDHDWISIDASGQYIVWSHQGGNDITVFDLDGNIVGNSANLPPSNPLRDSLKHVDCTLSGDGNTPFLIYVDRKDSDRIARCTLPDLSNVQKFTSGSSAFVSHASGRQYRQRADGRRFGSSFATGSSGNNLHRCLFRFDIDSGAIHQLGHHKTAGPTSTTGSESWHTLSPTGTRSIFTSTWEGTSSNNEQLYVLDQCESA